MEINLPAISDVRRPMLGLQCESNAEWIARVKDNTALLLSDHAHCEKKASVMAISLLSRYRERAELVDAMAELSIEEMSHFQMVIRKLKDRNLPLERDPGDNYVQALFEHLRKNEPLRLLDKLIVSSLIEARSCERFQLLSEHTPEEDLKEFYRSLLASEARHRNLFLKLAKLYFADEEVDKRLEEMQQIEASIVRSLDSKAVMHG